MQNKHKAFKTKKYMLEPYNTTPFTPQKNLEGRLFSSSFVNNSFRMEKNSSKRTYVLNRRILHYIKPWTVHLSQINPSSKQETKMRKEKEKKRPNEKKQYPPILLFFVSSLRAALLFYSLTLSTTEEDFFLKSNCI